MRGKKVLATFLAMAVSLSCFYGGGGIAVKAMNQSGEEESIEKETKEIKGEEETNKTNQEIINLALNRPIR